MLKECSVVEDDGDIVKALGFVTLNASYLEEQIELLVDLLEPVRQYSKGLQISSKITHSRKAIRKLSGNQFDSLLEDLNTCTELFLDRNELTHGRIYRGINRPDTLKSSRPEISDRAITSAELYQLANELTNFRLAVHRPMLFELPKEIEAFLHNCA
jgi:hypothetical protein